MFFRFHRGIPALSIFHNPRSPPSQAALQLLRSSLAEPFPSPPSPPLNFNLEVVDNAPTPTQFSIIQSILSRPLSSLLSAHPSDSNAAPNSPDEMSSLVDKQPNAMKYPLVVNWEDGEAAIGNVEAVRELLCKLAARQRKEQM